MKIQQLIHRVEQVKVAKLELIENRRIKMELKLQRATENREIILKNKIKKAHDEEEKLREIAFIKNIEQQNKRLELIEIHREQEVRLYDLEQERWAHVLLLLCFSFEIWININRSFPQTQKA